MKGKEYKCKCPNCGNTYRKGLEQTKWNINPFLRTYGCDCGIVFDVLNRNNKIYSVCTKEEWYGTTNHNQIK